MLFFFLVKREMLIFRELWRDQFIFRETWSLLPTTSFTSLVNNIHRWLEMQILVMISIVFTLKEWKFQLVHFYILPHLCRRTGRNSNRQTLYHNLLSRGLSRRLLQKIAWPNSSFPILWMDRTHWQTNTWIKRGFILSYPRFQIFKM